MSDADSQRSDELPQRAPRPFGWSYPRLLLVALVVTAGVAVMLVGTSSTAAFSPHNTEWDGTSQLQELAADNGTVAVAASTDRYESVEPSSTTAIVIAPESSYDSTDTERIQRFVEDGGMLVVADDFGPNGNQLLAAVGATARFDGAMLRDRENNFRQSSFPVANNVSEHPTTTTVEQLTLNNGTVIEPNGATPVVASSSFSYLDPVGADDLDDETAFSSYPVVTVEPVGEGTVLVVSDPSLLINAMLEQPDNEAFAANLVDTNDQTLVDSSHTAATPPLVDGVSWVRETPAVAAVVGVMLVGLVAVVGRQRSR